MSYEIIKYPRTPHLEGSKLQKGDEDLSQIPFKQIKGKYKVNKNKRFNHDYSPCFQLS